MILICKFYADELIFKDGVTVKTMNWNCNSYDYDDDWCKCMSNIATLTIYKW